MEIFCEKEKIDHEICGKVIVAVSDDEMDQAVILHLENTHNLTEHAGAASLAGAVKIKDQLAGKKVVLIMSGGNLSMQQLKELLEKHV